MEPVRREQSRNRSDTWRGTRILRFLALTLVLSLILVACGGAEGGESTTTADGGDDTTTTAGEEGGDTTTTAAAEEPDTERGTAADTFDMYNAMSGQERHDALVAAAQEEGSLVFYTASSGMDPVLGAFEDAYDIPVDLFTGQSDTVIQRLLQEYEAGFYGVDVFDDAEAYYVASQGMTHEYLNPEMTDGIPGYDPATHVAATRLSVYTQAWNTDLISDDEIPATIDGFTDPSFAGQMAMDPRDWVWYVGLSDYYINEQGWTQEEVDEMIATLAGASTYHEGHTVQAQLLLAGEFPVSLSVYTQSVDREIEADPEAPIAWRKEDGSWIEPLIFFPQGATLMKNAPHPAAAMLFVDFLLSEGQTILATEDRTPTAVSQPGGPLDGIPNEALHQVSMDVYLNQRDEWATRYDELLRGS
ncbi:MAG: extracellular solute-binding protein [Acidimicrobiia bacterium]